MHKPNPNLALSLSKSHPLLLYLEFVSCGSRTNKTNSSLCSFHISSTNFSARKYFYHSLPLSLSSSVCVSLLSETHTHTQRQTRITSHHLSWAILSILTALSLAHSEKAGIPSDPFSSSSFCHRHHLLIIIGDVVFTCCG